MNCKEFEELSGAFALDAVTPQERQEAEAHLAECPRCTKLYHELRAVVDLLPLSVPQVNPSGSLEERLFTAIREEGRPGADRSGTSAGQDRQRVLAGRRPARWQRLAMPLVVAAAVLFFVLSGVLSAWNISLQHQLAAVQQFAPQIVAVQGSGAAQGASGELVYYPQQGITVLIVHNLPQLQGSHVYQGWLLRGKQPTSIGLLNVQDGTASITFQGNASAQGYDATAVSVEPGPTATQGAPKGQIVAVGVIHRSST